MPGTVSRLVVAAVALAAACGPSDEAASPEALSEQRAALVLTATYDPVLKAPRCTGIDSGCDTGPSLILGRSRLGEPNTPNTVNGTCIDGASGVFHMDESLDRLQISTLDGSALAGGKTVRIDATVWAYSYYNSDRLDLYSAADATNPVWTLIGTFTPPGPGAQIITAQYTLPSTPLQAIRGQFRYGTGAAMVSCGSGPYDDRDDLIFSVTTAPDEEAPQVSISSPAAGATVQNVITVSVNASDNFGVSRVELYEGATLLGTDTTAPYALSWNTWQGANGPRTLTARAFDAAGHSTDSPPVTVTVSNDYTPPDVTITSPASGATVSGTVSITVNASDPSGITRVEFLVDGVLQTSDAYAPYTYDWASSSSTNGEHTLTARAFDGAGNSGVSAPVTVTVEIPGLAVYDETLGVPVCRGVWNSCYSSSTLLNGRATLGPEPHAPNTVAASTCADGPYGAYQQSAHLNWASVRTANDAPFARGREVKVSVGVWARFPSDTLYIYEGGDPAAPQWRLVKKLTAGVANTWAILETRFIPTSTSARQVIRFAFRESGTADAPCTSGPTDDHDDLVYAVGAEVDTTPPAVTMQWPSNGSYLRGIPNYPLLANTSDAFGVTSVDYFVNGVLLGSAAPGATVNWDTTTIPEGQYVITARAYDQAGNVGTSPDAVVTVDRTPPTVAFASPTPADGSTVSSYVTLASTSSPDTSYVDYAVDGQSIGSAQPNGLKSWDSRTAANGPHTITVVARDFAGNASAASQITVTSQNLTLGTATYDSTYRAPKCTGTSLRGCSSGSLLLSRGNVGMERNTPNTLYNSCLDGDSGSYFNIQEAVSSIQVLTDDETALAAGKPVSIWVESKVPNLTYRVDVYWAANANSPSWTLVTSYTPAFTGTSTRVIPYTLPAGAVQAVRVQVRNGGSASPCTVGGYNERDDLVFEAQ